MTALRQGFMPLLVGKGRGFAVVPLPFGWV